MRLVPLLLAVLASACTTAATTERTRLCDALARVKPGEHLFVTVMGVVMSGGEMQVLFDPDEPVCRQNVQPATWLAFAPGANGGDISRALSAEGRARVVLQGVLHGPRVVVDDPLGDAALSARARATNRRYGHLNTFRTQFVVEQVLSAAAASIDAEADWNAVPRGSKPFVVSGAVPIYPELARAAGIAGEVRLVVTVLRGAVSEVTVQSGERLLAQSASENVKSWRFEVARNDTFETTFSYLLERRDANANLNARVQMSLPERVTIVGAADDW